MQISTQSINNSNASTVFTNIFIVASCLKIGLGQLLWSPRILTFDDAIYFNGAPQSPNIFFAQLLTIIALASGFLVTVTSLRYFKQLFNNQKLLIASWVAFIASQMFVDLTHGIAINPERFTPIFIPFVALVHANHSKEVYRSLLISFGAIILSGLLIALINPDWSFIFDYQGDYALFERRYLGLLSHPNQIGALAALTAIISFPQKSGASLFVFAGSLVTLMLSQSKTSIGALVVAGLILLINRRFAFNGFSKISTKLLLSLFYSFWFIVLLLGLDAPGDELMTMTGRTQIWAESVEIWRANPVWGAGSAVFDVDFRQLSELSGAISAHNQFLNTLAINGVMGVVTMSCFLFFAYQCLFTTARNTNTTNIGVAAMVLILIRGLTEPSLSSQGIGIPYLYVFVLFLAIQSGATKKSERPDVRPSNETASTA